MLQLDNIKHTTKYMYKNTQKSKTYTASLLLPTYSVPCQQNIHSEAIHSRANPIVSLSFIFGLNLGLNSSGLLIYLSGLSIHGVELAIETFSAQIALTALAST